MSALAAARDLRDYRDPVSGEQLERFETDSAPAWPAPRPIMG
ncbi:hypothetical protein [Streptomyces sp. NPDC096033]